jgi:hypothetical protein
MIFSIYKKDKTLIIVFVLKFFFLKYLLSMRFFFNQFKSKKIVMKMFLVSQWEFFLDFFEHNILSKHAEENGHCYFYVFALQLINFKFFIFAMSIVILTCPTF